MFSTLHLVFIAEWALFLLFELLRGRLRTPAQFAAAWPLLFFYVVGAVLIATQRKRERLASTPVLYLLAALLVGLDLALKALAEGLLPEGGTLTLLPGLLDFTHTLNRQGSWLAQVAGAQPSLALRLVLLLVGAGMLPFAALVHAYYIARVRRSPWADVAFLGIAAGVAGSLADLLLRGAVLDYIGLPGVVAADGKDLYLWLGVSGVLAEMLTSPDQPWRWRGWKDESASAARQIRDLFDFARRKPH